VFQGGLNSSESATVVRESDGDFLITDGPYRTITTSARRPSRRRDR
jgi:hypothetical protein